MLPSRVPALALFAASLGAIACLWLAWCEFPFYAWNEVRLAPAFAIRHGINPYPLIGDGPLSTWIYGPVGALLDLPATFAPNVLAALQTAWLINALTVLAPLAVVFFTSAELRARGRVFPWLALASALLFVPRPNLVLQVADHSAIAFGLLSCWCLVHWPVARVRLPLAAALVAVAIWSKQITVFLLLAQFAFLWRHERRIAAWRHLGWVSAFGILGAAVFSVAFGFANLWLNLVDIPGRLGWADFGPRLIMRPWSLSFQVLVPAVALLAVWRSRTWPTLEQESGRFFRLMALVFVAMLPIGLIAFFKIGGDTNLLHSWQYLLPGAMLVALAGANDSPAGSTRILVVVACGLGLRATQFEALPTRPFTSHLAAAEALVRAHPHHLWFPQNPLITFYADGKLWHSEDGIATRHLAGYGLREPDFRRHLPSPLEGVVYPSSVKFPFAMPLLPEFSQSVRTPYWIWYARPSPPPHITGH
jgi:hypothetical protein